MIRTLYHPHTGSIRTDLHPDEIKRALQDRRGLLWVDFVGESPETCTFTHRHGIVGVISWLDVTLDRYRVLTLSVKRRRDKIVNSVPILTYPGLI